MSVLGQKAVRILKRNLFPSRKINTAVKKERTTKLDHQNGLGCVSVHARTRPGEIKFLGFNYKSFFQPNVLYNLFISNCISFNYVILLT